MSVHEPALTALFPADADGQKMSSWFDEQLSLAASLIAEGRNEEAAKNFVEQVAFGSGYWSLFPPEVKQVFITNAATFLDEANDPEALTINLEQLSAYPGRVLLTQGSESPAFFGLIVNKLAAALPHAERTTINGAGHGVAVSHPKEYAETLMRFASN
ncbi:MAG: alpha/beta fold hydrolase [Actinomycetota bacterium]